METLQIEIGNFNGTLNRVPKNMKETAHVIISALEKLKYSIENDNKSNITIYLVTKNKLKKNERE